MQRVYPLVWLVASTILGQLPKVAAHNEEQDVPAARVTDVSSATSKGVTMQGDLIPSYFSLASHTSLMYSHTVIMVISWVILLPISVVLGIARSKFALVTQYLFLIANGIGLICGIAYNRQTPDLYENDSHSKIGWFACCFVLCWVSLSSITSYQQLRGTRKLKSELPVDAQDAAVPDYRKISNANGQLPNSRRWSEDLGESSVRDSTSTCCESRSTTSTLTGPQLDDVDRFYGDDYDEEIEISKEEKHAFLGDMSNSRKIPFKMFQNWHSHLTKFLKISYTVLNRSILMLGFIALSTGVVVWGGIGRGNHVYSVLAHFIKGGIFFWYGILTLGRWMGSFADLGWAWNVKPQYRKSTSWKSAVPTAEFVESFLIFLYGASNVFLEHLASWGQAWSSEDLEHVSITIMFFGGGLLGMLIESRWVRDLLSNSIVSATKTSNGPRDVIEPPKQYRTAANPIPGLIIMLVGIMMSSHHQASMLSTMVHKQWGTLFVVASLARAVTYIFVYMRPPSSILPSRPPSELVTAFCLMSGGLIFMGSNMDTVSALESVELDAMFTFNLTTGMTCLTMAWVIFVIAIKSWATQRGRITPSISKSSRWLQIFA